MSVGMTTINNVPQPQQEQTGMVSPSMAAIARRQRWQDEQTAFLPNGQRPPA